MSGSRDPHGEESGASETETTGEQQWPTETEAAKAAGESPEDPSAPAPGNGGAEHGSGGATRPNGSAKAANSEGNVTAAQADEPVGAVPNASTASDSAEDALGDSHTRADQQTGTAERPNTSLSGTVVLEEAESGPAEPGSAAETPTPGTSLSGTVTGTVEPPDDAAPDSAVAESAPDASADQRGLTGSGADGPAGAADEIHDDRVQSGSDPRRRGNESANARAEVGEAGHGGPSGAAKVEDASAQDDRADSERSAETEKESVDTTEAETDASGGESAEADESSDASAASEDQDGRSSDAELAEDETGEPGDAADADGETEPPEDLEQADAQPAVADVVEESSDADVEIDSQQSESAEATASAEPGAEGEPDPPKADVVQPPEAATAKPPPAAEPPAAGPARSGEAAEPGPAAVPPESAVERTQQIPRIEPEAQTVHPRPPDTRATAIEQTQQIPVVRPEQGTRKPEEPADTARIDRRPSAPDQGPPTTRIPPVPPVEHPTQQIPLPDLRGSQPRTAQPQDFLGLQPYSKPVQPVAQARSTEPVRKPEQARATDPIYKPPEPQAASTDEIETVPAKAGGRRPLVIVLALVGVIVIGAGLVFGGTALVNAITAVQTAPPPAPVVLRPTIKEVDRSAPTPSKTGLSAVMEGPVSDPALGTLVGVVRDAETGEVLWERDADQALVPASTGKLLTTSAAMLALDPDRRLVTEVVQGEDAGTVVLVGGGDPTLSSLHAGEESVYPGAPRLDDLAKQVHDATDGKVERIVVDTSRYQGPELGPAWIPEDVQAGYFPPVEPVMLDGGRANPAEENSTRSQTPALDAGRALAERLGVSAAAVSEGQAPRGAKTLGEVRSQTIRDLAQLVLQHSDNMLAEALAREVAIATGHEASFSGASDAVRSVLERNGFDLSGSTMVDGSGLSTLSNVTPKLLGSLLATATAPERGEGGLPAKTAKLRALLPGLPVAGGFGSLSDRYGSSDGRGWVRAKTGTLNGVNSLAGTVLTRDGRLLVFALMSNGTSPGEARPALDEVAATLHGCGCQG